MLKKTFLAAIGVAVTLSASLAAPVHAQNTMAPGADTRAITDQNNRAYGERARPGRQNRNTQPASPTPEAVVATAQVQATAAGIACEVTTASLLGFTPERTPMYEATCASGPGYILIASTPPESIDCLELAGTAFTARLGNPAADVGQQCLLPANQNGLAVIGGWAREAGVACTIDQAIAFGKGDGNNVIYEVGCAGTDGYWLEKVASGWKLQDCLQVTATGGTCHFTTVQEQADGFEPKLAGTEASGCDVARVRLMGANSNGRFYEAKCAAEGEGYIARVNTEGATQQIYPCATAQRIGGGCTLTPAPATAPAPTE